MHRIFAVCVVHKANNALGALWDDYGRARTFTVIANQASRLELGIDLLSERLDLKFIIPNLLPSDRIGDFPVIN